METAELLLTEAEAAKSLKLSRHYLFTLRRQGQIPYVPFGRAVRYRPEQLRAWLASRTRGGGHGQSQ
jgi:excisionase family DNA binding protein